MSEYVPLCKSSVPIIYRQIMEDVISKVKEDFLEEGIDEQVLQDLKQIWEINLAGIKRVPDVPKEQDKIINKSSGSSEPTQNLASASTSGAAQAVPEAQMVLIEITLPLQPGTVGPQRKLKVQVSSTILQGNQLQKALSSPVVKAIISLPNEMATSLLQQHFNGVLLAQQTASAIKHSSQGAGMNCDDLPNKKKKTAKEMSQVDGHVDTSDDSSEESDSEETSDEIESEKSDEESLSSNEEEPLNSNDDDDDFEDTVVTDNIIVCQFEKVHRRRNKWMLHLKDGIMNLDGLDYVFHKASGETKW